MKTHTRPERDYVKQPGHGVFVLAFLGALVWSTTLDNPFLFGTLAFVGATWAIYLWLEVTE